jgi:hypothetical protein
MLKLTCLCGQVRIEVAKRPDFINECNCTLCSKSGARWSYFHPSEVSIEGATREYGREDKDDPAAELHFCGRCGSTTHFTLTESAMSKFGNVQTGVNMSLADESDLVVGRDRPRLCAGAPNHWPKRDFAMITCEDCR